MCRIITTTYSPSNGEKGSQIELCENAHGSRPCSLLSRDIERPQVEPVLASSSRASPPVLHQAQGSKAKVKHFDKVEVKLGWKGPKYRLINSEKERRKERQRAKESYHPDDPSCGLPDLPSRLPPAPSPPPQGVHYRLPNMFDATSPQPLHYANLVPAPGSTSSFADSGYATVPPPPPSVPATHRTEIIVPSSTASTASSSKGKAPARDLPTTPIKVSKSSNLRVEIPASRGPAYPTSSRASSSQADPLSPTHSHATYHSHVTNLGLSRFKPTTDRDYYRDSALGTSVASPASPSYQTAEPGPSRRSNSRSTTTSRSSWGHGIHSASPYGRNTASRAQDHDERQKELERARKEDSERRAAKQRDAHRNDAYARLSGEGSGHAHAHSHSHAHKSTPGGAGSSIARTSASSASGSRRHAAHGAGRGPGSDADTFDNSRYNYYNDGTSSRGRRSVGGRGSDGATESKTYKYRYVSALDHHRPSSRSPSTSSSFSSSSTGSPSRATHTGTHHSKRTSTSRHHGGEGRPRGRDRTRRSSRYPPSLTGDPDETASLMEQRLADAAAHMRVADEASTAATAGSPHRRRRRRRRGAEAGDGDGETGRRRDEAR